VTYPNREDFESYEAFDRARTAAREDAARADLDRTGICTRRILPTDQVRVSCSVRLHAEALHPGFTNPDPDLTGCVVCHLKVLAAPPRPLRLEPGADGEYEDFQRGWEGTARELG
jgi:hypothetical protein